MSNERITEKLIIDFLTEKEYYKNEDINIELQKSDNIVIKNLLNKASKSGKGNPGRPEFIITTNKDNNFVIIIEAKFNQKDHISKKFKNFIKVAPNEASKYNVDGLIWYSYFLKNNFNIIAIAITGNDNENINIDQYFIKKDEPNNFTKKINYKNILDIDKYLELYKEEINFFDSKIQKTQISSLADKINNLLRDHYEIENHMKPLLISMILISMEKLNDDIENKNIFKNINEKELYKKIKDSAINKINSEISSIQEKMDIVKKQFDLIDHFFKDKNQKINNINSKNTDSVFANIVLDLYYKVYKIIKSHNYTIDPIGIFYSQFLKYATGEGKDLGQVLTPGHITDLFVKLTHDGSGLNLNDKVIDICAGSGGFLISAYKKMLYLANSRKDIEKIKEENLFGYEISSPMFSLAITNMILLGDGKTNLYNKDCFKDNTLKGRANIGYINPPYSKKKTDRHEFEFIKRLSQLVQNNKNSAEIIAIVPSSILGKDSLKNQRKNLLKNHTIKAVITMPDDLFYPSANVNTAIIIFKPNVPHDFDKHVWMARLKDDSGKKEKQKGRIINKDKWEKISDEIISFYKNKETDKNNFKYIKIKINDENSEWLPEAYVNTDYSQLTEKYFENKIKDQIAYRIKNNLFNEKNIFKNNIKTKIDLFENIEWKEFKYNEVFDLHKKKNKFNFTIKRIEKYNVLNSEGDIPYVSASEFFHGITAYTSIEEENKCIAPKISLANSGSVGKAFYHELNFVGTDSIYAFDLIDKKELDVFVGIFITTLIEFERYRYNFGRAWRSYRLLDSKIKLPINNDGNINYEFMRKYIKSFEYSKFL